MLSIETPDPSCSCKISGLKCDGRAGEKLALQEAADLVKPVGLDDNQLPHFSIRNYVFTARSKDIEANWPFQERLLQLCLKHGVKDLLPPFEPPKLVRSQCHGVRLEHLNACVGSEKALAETDSLDKVDAGFLDLPDNHIKHKPSQLSDRSVLEFLDQGDEELCRLSKSLGSDEAGGRGDITSTLTSHVEINSNSFTADRLTSPLIEINGLSEASTEFEALEPPFPSSKTGSLCGPSDKKCRFIVKLGGISDSSRTEDIVSNSSALSEPMASKVCPVCKTFVSTSNTTLNAHIDQCLAVESNCNQVLTDMTKYRVKPRKKRLMVDIYAAAPRCTLEDLDRRNGTNWATDSNSPMLNGEIHMECKRQRMRQVDVAEDGDDERAVYVDSNGTKLRILSKFNDSVVPSLGDRFTQRNHSKNTKEGKIFFMSKKKRLVPKCPKRQKVKPQSKKLCTLKLYKGEIPEALDAEYHVSNYEKEKSLSQLLKGQDAIKSSGSGTLRQWVCSKRSGPSKKNCDRDGCGCAGNQPLIESNLSALGNSTKKNHILKFSRLSENPAASLKSKRVEIPLNSTDNDKRTSPRPLENKLDGSMVGTSVSDGCMLKFARYSGSYVSSPRSKRVEINTGTAQLSPKLPDSHPFSPRAKRSSASRKDLLSRKPSLPSQPSKNAVNRKNMTFKKSQEDRYAAEMSEQVGSLPSEVDDCYDGTRDCTKILGPGFVNHKNTHTSHKLNRLQKILGSEIEEITIEESHGRNKVSESEQESENVSTSEQEETLISEGLRSAVEYYSLDMENAYSEEVSSFHQYYKSDDQEAAAEEVKEKSVRHNIVSSFETPSSDGNAPATRAYGRSPGLEGDHVGPVRRAKSQVLSATPRPFSNQEMNCVEQEGFKAQVSTEVEAGSFTETNLTVIQRLGESFLSAGDMGFEVQENSSVTSSGPHIIQDKHLQVERDQSGSPVSPNSAVSPPPMIISSFKYSGQEASSAGPSEIQDKVGVSFSDYTAVATLLDGADSGPDSALPSTLSVEGAEKAKLDKENLKVAILPTKEPVKISDHQPCCCSRKESISGGAAQSYQESQLLRKKGMVATMIVPPKGRQVATSNPNIRPEFCPSFSTCSGSTIDKMVIPPIDSSVGSTSMQASLNAAMELQTCRDFGLGSPLSQTLPSPSSTCSPVLRLMGKDLMVTRKDEDESAGLQKISLAATNDHSNLNYLTLLGFSTGNVSKQDSFSFHNLFPDDSFIVGLDPCYPPMNFDAGFSGVVRTPSDDMVVHQTPLQPPVNHQDMCTTSFVGSAMQQGPKTRADGQSQQKTLNDSFIVGLDPCYPPKNFDVGFSGVVRIPSDDMVVHQTPLQPPVNHRDMCTRSFVRSAMQQGPKARADGQSQQKSLNGNPLLYSNNVERSTLHRRLLKPVSASQAANPTREVIVIDDSPELGPSSSSIDAKYRVRSRGNQLLPVDLLPLPVPNSNSSPMKASSCFPLPNTFSRELSGGPNSSFLMLCPRVNASFSKRGDSAVDGPVILSPGPSILPSPSMGYLNPTPYYSPSLQ